MKRDIMYVKEKQYIVTVGWINFLIKLRNQAFLQLYFYIMSYDIKKGTLDKTKRKNTIHKKGV